MKQAMTYQQAEYLKAGDVVTVLSSVGGSHIETVIEVFSHRTHVDIITDKCADDECITVWKKGARGSRPNVFIVAEAPTLPSGPLFCGRDYSGKEN